MSANQKTTTGYSLLPTEQEGDFSKDIARIRTKRPYKRLLALSVASIVVGMLFVRSSAWKSLRMQCGYRGIVSQARIPSPIDTAGYKLPSGDVIPGIALGTWKAKPGEVGDAVTTALEEVREPSG